MNALIKDQQLQQIDEFAEKQEDNPGLIELSDKGAEGKGAKQEEEEAKIEQRGQSL